MARTTGKASPNKTVPAVAAPPAANDVRELTLAELAQAIVTRQIIRPRVAQLRQLAEAVLAGEEKRARRKAKDAGGKKKGGDKKRKLAKIPGQKKRA